MCSGLLWSGLDEFHVPKHCSSDAVVKTESLLSTFSLLLHWCDQADLRFEASLDGSTAPGCDLQVAADDHEHSRKTRELPRDGLAENGGEWRPERPERNNHCTALFQLLWAIRSAMF